MKHIGNKYEIYQGLLMKFSSSMNVLILFFFSSTLSLAQNLRPNCSATLTSIGEEPEHQRYHKNKKTIDGINEGLATQRTNIGYKYYSTTHLPYYYVSEERRTLATIDFEIFFGAEDIILKVLYRHTFKRPQGIPTPVYPLGDGYGLTIPRSELQAPGSIASRNAEFEIQHESLASRSIINTTYKYKVTIECQMMSTDSSSTTNSKTKTYPATGV